MESICRWLMGKKPRKISKHLCINIRFMSGAFIELFYRDQDWSDKLWEQLHEHLAERRDRLKNLVAVQDGNLDVHWIDLDCVESVSYTDLEKDKQ